MRLMKLIACLAAAAAAVGGCGGANVRIDYYALAAPPARTAPAQSNALSVHLGPVSVPDGVDRPQIVMRRDANQVSIDDVHRWAEPLKDAIPRVLSDALAAELGTPRVLTSRQSASLDFDYRVAIDVQHFDSSAAEAREDVIWTIRTRGNEPARVGRTVVAEPAAGGFDSLAAAHSRALAQVARDIAQAIRAMAKP
ncbi:MAG TPA: PqiC family protein [Usitatibacter sp.]|jgi:hypothetical protein|nr:PqiC family protein [Usitatibacter sp.]